LVPGLHVPEHAPPLHTAAHGAPGCQVPVESHVSGVKLSHCRVAGVHEPVHTPSVHRKGHVSTRVVVTRSIPHSRRSSFRQNTVPAVCPWHSSTMGWHDPALLPGVVSQLLVPKQVPFATHLPLSQMSCPFCACPAHA
jgi:hypothetical protein